MGVPGGGFENRPPFFYSRIIYPDFIKSPQNPPYSGKSGTRMRPNYTSDEGGGGGGGSPKWNAWLRPILIYIYSITEQIPILKKINV